MARDELAAVLDFILNRAEPAELEVLIKALERRKRDQGKYAGLGGMNPGAMAEKMGKAVNQGVQDSMDSMRSTVRSFVEGIIRQNAPEATEAEVAVLLDHYAGRTAMSAMAAKAEGESRALVDEDGRKLAPPQVPPQATLPPDALAMMLRDFTEYSLGLMAPSKQKDLWDWMPRWQDMYWESFPSPIKNLVKARLEGRMEEEDFWKAALSILGL